MTEAEFRAFLRHGGSEVAVIVEIDFSYESGGALATGMIRIADRAEAVAGSQPYPDGIASAPEIERSIDLERLGGRGSRATGSITLNNKDGRFDYLLDVIIDGHDASILIGGKGWARADYRLLGKGTVASVSAPNDDEIVISLRDKNFLLDKTVIGDTIATGPNAGKPKPILLGRVKNIDLTPFLFDTAALKYYINNFALSTFGGPPYGLADLRDNGVSLEELDYMFWDSGSITADAGTNTLTYAAHGLQVNDVLTGNGSGTLFAGLSKSVQYWVIAAGLTADDFRLSLTKGGAAVDITGTVIAGSVEIDRRRFYVDAAAATVELSSPPAGRLTMDVGVIDAAGFFTSTARPHDVFEWLIENYSGLTAPEYDGTAIDALAADSGSILYGRAILDRTNLIDLLDEIAVATCSWYGWNASGVLTVGRLDLANLDAETAVDEITDDDLSGDLSSENQPLPWGKVNVDARRNVTQQAPDGLAGAVDAEDRSLWAQPFQKRASTTDPATATYLANWWDYHRSATDSRPIPLEIDSGQQEAADNITELFAPWTRVHRGVVGLDKYALNPGDCVTVVYPRAGLSAGKKCRVVSVKPRASDRECDVVLVRQALPDYTTAVH